MGINQNEMKKMLLRCMIKEQNGYFVGSCLELSLSARGKSVSECKRALLKLIEELVSGPTNSYLISNPTNPQLLVEERLPQPVIITKLRHGQLTMSPNVIPSLIKWLETRYKDYQAGVNLMSEK